MHERAGGANSNICQFSQIEFRTKKISEKLMEFSIIQRIDATPQSVLEFSRKVLTVQKNAEAEDICNIFSITHGKSCKITKTTA